MKESFDIMTLVEPFDHPKQPDIYWVLVDPSVMYPAMRDHIIKIVQSKATGPQYLEQFRLNAVQFDERHWRLFDCAIDEIESDEDLFIRSYLLEVARRWFTAMLHKATDEKPLGIKITKNLYWRLIWPDGQTEVNITI